MADFGSLALSYAAGALSTMSPCVLPLLPIILVGVLERHARGPLALAAGLSASFATIGIAIASFGFSVGLDPSTFRLGVAVLVVSLGGVLLVRMLQTRLAIIATPVATGGKALLTRLRPSGISGQFVLGRLLGAIWSPCSGPTLGATIGLAARGETLGKAAATMLTFGLGAATSIPALAYGSRHAIFARRDRLARMTHFAKPLMGTAFVAIGGLVLTGFDKIVETSETRAMPDRLVTVTTRL